jgi:hypothetical protein
VLLRDEVLIRSYDDKAYICPGTSTGMRSTRKQCVFTSSETEKQRALPKYDFPTAMVNLTPGVILYMTKSINDENGTEWYGNISRIPSIVNYKHRL